MIEKERKLGSEKHPDRRGVDICHTKLSFIFFKKDYHLDYSGQKIDITQN